MMLDLHIEDEISPLRAVVLGTADHIGLPPAPEEVYDPKSLEHILAGTYPTRLDMVHEIEAFAQVLKKYQVEVYRPEIIQNYNQIFTRDIGFVIDDIFIKANILPDRAKEIEAIQYILEHINPQKIIQFPAEVHVEGGDVILWRDYIFVGTCKSPDYSTYITARTHPALKNYLQTLFPHKKVKMFDLIKSNTNARENALHLDCCFQPVGKSQAIIYREGFKDPADYQFLVDLFGIKNLFHITQQEMYDMNSNIFSIAPDVVVSEQKFTRLNEWLNQQKFKVELVPYAEIAKQEGLLRCSTLPLIRQK